MEGSITIKVKVPWMLPIRQCLAIGYFNYFRDKTREAPMERRLRKDSIGSSIRSGIKSWLRASTSTRAEIWETILVLFLSIHISLIKTREIPLR